MRYVCTAMNKDAFSLEAMLDRMNRLIDEGEAQVSAGNAMVDSGRRMLDDALKIRDAIKVIDPELRLPSMRRVALNGPSTGPAHSDESLGGEGVYGYWTGLVNDALMAHGGKANVRQLASWIAKKPEHANANALKLKASVRNALRSSLKTGRVTSHKVGRGTFFEAININERST